MIRRSLVPLVLCAALLPATPSGSAEAADVTIGDSYYDPQTVTVQPGQTVRWTHQGSLPHSVTADDGSFDSSPGCDQYSGAGCMTPGSTFQRAFTELGSFPYHCKVHFGMAGAVNVVEPEDPTAVPTAVTALAGAQVPGGVAVSGAARFGGQKPVLVSDDDTGDGPGMASFGDTKGPDVTGVDLLGAMLSVPDPGDPELLVQWQATNFESTVGLPEATRFSFSFKVGASVYQVHAKLSNVVSPSGAGDPAGAAGRIGGTFELRGSCTPSLNGMGIPSCTRLAWLDGSVDAQAGIVSALVPVGSAIAPGIVPGASLHRNDSGVSELDAIIAGYQVGGVAVTEALNDKAVFGPEKEPAFAFLVAKKEVTLGIAPVGTDPAAVDFFTPASLAGDDAFSGTVSTDGFAPGTFDVYARACFAGNCGVRSLGGMTHVGDGSIATLKLGTDPDQSFAFWRGGLVGNRQAHSQPVSAGQSPANCDNSPCFRYTLKVASAGAARLRVAIDTPARNDNFVTQVTTPDGEVLSEANANNFNREIFVVSPPVGDYAILVRPYSASNTTFGMRAKLEAAIPVPTPEPDGSILPDLRPSAPYGLHFMSAQNGTGQGGDDSNPPMDVAGVHPLSCNYRTETLEYGATRCLRFSFGLVNVGPGNFDIRWIGNAQTQPEADNYQCVQQAEGPPIARRSGRSEWHQSHGHWHFLDLVQVDLFHVTDPANGTMSRRGSGRKLGYFPADQSLAKWHEFDAGTRATSSTFGNCLSGFTNRLGMSPGWGDVYRYQREGNFVPFEGEPDGLYVVRLIIDTPGGTSDIREANETNNVSYAYIRVTGDRVDVLEQGRGQSPWDQGKDVLQPRYRGGVPW